MKSTLALLAVGATIAAAQDLSKLPQCGQTCINNMLGIAQSQFGCGQGDIACYCTNKDFGYGVRDCSNEACQNASDAAAVIAFGTAFCQQFLASAGSSATGAASTGALAPLTSALATVSGASELLSSASGALAGGAQSTAITTSPLVATVVSGDQTQLQTTGFVTLYSALSGATESAGSAIASATDSAGSVIASATDSAGSAIASATGSAASAASSALASAESSAASAASSVAASISGALSSARSSAASAATAASTGGAAPMMTGLPLAGAAGVAALLLL